MSRRDGDVLALWPTHHLRDAPKDWVQLGRRERHAWEQTEFPTLPSRVCTIGSYVCRPIFRSVGFTTAGLRPQVSPALSECESRNPKPWPSRNLRGDAFYAHAGPHGGPGVVGWRHSAGVWTFELLGVGFAA